MAAASILSKLCSWHVEGHSIRIEYPATLLAEINVAVIEGLNRFRRGGIEIGGLLFGAWEQNLVRVQAFRSFDCEHAFGPNFLLSDQDRASLEELLRTARAEPGLRGLIPVGWYRSRTRKGIHLSPEDVEIFDQFFPHPWQIALVLRPEPFAPTTAGFFFREDDGVLRTESSHAEFSLDSPPVQAPVDNNEKLQQDESSREIQERELQSGPPRQIETLRIEPSPLTAAPVQSAESKRSDAPSQQQTTEIQEARPSIRKTLPIVKSILYAMTLGLILAGVYFGMARNVPRPVKQTSLTVEDRGEQLWIGWDPKIWGASLAAKATLEIHEGDHTTSIDLDKAQLQTGSVTYSRQSGNVWVRLRSDESDEWVAYMGRPADPPPAKKPEQREPGFEKLNHQADEIKRLQQRIDAYSSKENATPAPAKARLFIAPAKQSRPATILPLDAPPVDKFGGSITPPALLGRLPSAASIVVVPRETHLRTGTIIWTGRLAKNSILTIDANRVSTGSLTGEIPAIPMRVRVHPAELTEDGLTVYTTGTTYPDGYAEPASATNGWNRTRYRIDLARARSLSVTEPPSANNQWKRLVLRSNQSGLSIVLIVWDAL